VAEGRNDPAAELDWCERNLPLARAVNHRFIEANTLRQLGSLQHRRGDAAAALPLYRQAQGVFRAMYDALPACESAVRAAECEWALGRPDAALSTVIDLLDALVGELAPVRPPDTVGLRWRCHGVLEAAGDARAAGLLEQLHTDVQADIANLAKPADRDRLMRDRPTYGAIVAAYGRRRLLQVGG
jgi:hypothetical protein